MTDALDALLSAGDLVAVLGRSVPVRLIDISNAGCLLESTCRLEKGAAGHLRVVFDDAEYMDDVLIIRCQESEGGSGLFSLGAEFLWTTSPHERSLRRVINKLQGSAVRSVNFDRKM